MSKLEIYIAQATGSFPEYMERRHKAVVAAATRTMDDVKDRVLKDGRASIAAAGFPVGVQKALRGERFPRGAKESINASVYIWHRSSYSGIFETGGTIQGRPLLWIPLSTTMPKLGRDKVTPGMFAARGVKLVSLKSKKGTPLLGAYVPTDTKANRRKFASGKVSWNMIKQGRGDGSHRAVPLFFGIKAVTIPKKFGVVAAAEAAEREIPALFFKHYEDM